MDSFSAFKCPIFSLFLLCSKIKMQTNNFETFIQVAAPSWPPDEPDYIITGDEFPEDTEEEEEKGKKEQNEEEEEEEETTEIEEKKEE